MTLQVLVSVGVCDLFSLVLRKHKYSTKWTVLECNVGGFPLILTSLNKIILYSLYPRGLDFSEHFIFNSLVRSRTCNRKIYSILFCWNHFNWKTHTGCNLCSLVNIHAHFDSFCYSLRMFCLAHHLLLHSKSYNFSWLNTQGSFTSTGLVVSSKLPRFSDEYTLTIDSADPKSISAGKSVQLTKSVTQWSLLSLTLCIFFLHALINWSLCIWCLCISQVHERWSSCWGFVLERRGSINQGLCKRRTKEEEMMMIWY